LTNPKVLLLLAAMAVLAVSCAPVDVPPPAVVPEDADRFLIDPRVGYDVEIVPALDARFDTAWRWVQSGNETEARKRLADILTRQPDFTPAILAQAALDIRAGRFAEARAIVERAKQRVPNYTAAQFYEAEIALREGQTRVAYDLYRRLAADANAPEFARERVAELQGQLFNELFASAQTASNADAVRLLREALTFNPQAIEPRIMLGQRLVALRQFDEARREIDPALNTAADRAEVQEILAEVDLGRGRYEEAIVRYDRLAKRTREPRYTARLEEIKQEWSAANMPSHFRTALSSPAITRAELATLLYWTVPAIRFAQNLASPPIAIDVDSVAGREEVIRAIAIGLFEVDPVTRRVNPSRAVTAARLSTHLARVLTLRAASCARGIPQDRVLASCSVSDPLATATTPDAPVTGSETHRILTEVAKALQ
jgi:tetratricopeptide (TPR) repeat protein